MMKKKTILAAVPALVVGATLLFTGTAFAGYQSTGVGTTDNNTRVEGYLWTTGATVAWIYGECDWSVGNIETPRVKHLGGWDYQKSSDTCWYGVEGGALAAGIG